LGYLNFPGIRRSKRGVFVNQKQVWAVDGAGPSGLPGKTVYDRQFFYYRSVIGRGRRALREKRRQSDTHDDTHTQCTQ
jgi:hypothetical protein